MQSSTPVGVEFLLNPENDAHSQDSAAASLSSSPSQQNTTLPASGPASNSSSVENMAAAAIGMPPSQAVTSGPPQSMADDQRQDLPRPYKCPLCDKAFHRLEHQTRHIRTHTGEKPHACQYPGCTKRFSRSDELTRHSRIHSNPQARRGNKAQNAAAAAAAAALANGPLPEGQVVAHILPAPSQGYPHSHPASSNPTSPNVSPPHSYAQYGLQGGHPGHAIPPAGQYSGGGHENNTTQGYTQGYQQRPLDINLLATAASQVERENPSPYFTPNRGYQQTYQHQPPYHHRPLQYTQHPPSHPAPHPAPSSGPSSLSAYRYSPGSNSQPMSRSHSYEDDDPYSHRATKKSRPASLHSTNPPSPIFTVDSINSTPSHTPALTPAHSPRMRPQHAPHDTHLPSIRHLSLKNQLHAPALDTLEPSTDASSQHSHYNQQPYSRSRNNSGMSISEIISRPDDITHRKLPAPGPPSFTLQDSPTTSGSPGNKYHHNG